jgi:hypothetical protein
MSAMVRCKNYVADEIRELKIPNRHSDREHSEANMKSRLYKRVC